MRRFRLLLVLLLALAGPVDAATFVAGNGTRDDATDNSLATVVTGTNTGNLVLCYVKWEGATTTVAISDGTTTFTADATGIESHTNGDHHAVLHYLLASAGGNDTMTATLGANRPFKHLACGSFAYTGTVARDTGVIAEGGGVGGELVNSGNFTPTFATEGVALGCWGAYETITPTANHAINGVADDGAFGLTDGTQCWYRLLATGFTNGAATVTKATSEEAWVAGGYGFEVTAGGGGGAVLPQRTLVGVGQ